VFHRAAKLKAEAMELDKREQAILSREAAVHEREIICTKHERHLERQLAAARRDAFTEREALRAERERWEDEKRAAASSSSTSSSAAVAQQQQQPPPQLQQAVRRPCTGAYSGGGEQSPTDMDGVMDIPGSAVKAVGSRVPRRSFVPKPLEERK
jgi:hypothetical protein